MLQHSHIITDTDPFNGPEATVGSVVSPENLKESRSTAYYSQPFSSHLPRHMADTRGTSQVVKSNDIATVPNVSYGATNPKLPGSYLPGG